MTKALVILISIAIVLGIVAYFAVFSPGTYEFTSSGSSSSGTLSFNGLANDTTGTPTSTNKSNVATTSAAFATSTPGNGIFVSQYSYPYVMDWSEGQNDFSVTAAQFDGQTLTLALKVQIGNVGGCIPIDLRLVVDETGDVQAPNQPQFIFPDTSSCNATPNATYQNQLLTFTIPGVTPTPFVFTTGGTSNQFFEITTSTDGGLQIQLPATSG